MYVISVLTFTNTFVEFSGTSCSKPDVILVDSLTRSQMTFCFCFMIYGNIVDNLLGKVKALQVGLTILIGVQYVLFGFLVITNHIYKD